MRGARWQGRAAEFSGELPRMQEPRPAAATEALADAHGQSGESTACKPPGAARSKAGGDRKLARGARVGILAWSLACSARATARRSEPVAGKPATRRRATDVVTPEHP